MDYRGPNAMESLVDFIEQATMAGRPPDKRVINRDKGNDKKENFPATTSGSTLGLVKHFSSGNEVSHIAVMTKDGSLIHRPIYYFDNPREDKPLHQQLKEYFKIPDDDVVCGGSFTVKPTGKKWMRPNPYSAFTMVPQYDIEIKFQSGICNGCSNYGQFTDKEMEQKFEEKIRKLIRGEPSEGNELPMFCHF